MDSRHDSTPTEEAPSTSSESNQNNPQSFGPRSDASAPDLNEGSVTGRSSVAPSLPQENLSTFVSDSEPTDLPKVAINPSIDQMIANNNQGYIAVNQFANSNKKPKRKKLIVLSVLASIIVLLLAAGTAFALIYNKPENVVGDSMLKLMTAESGTLESSVATKSKDGSSTINAKIDINNHYQTHTSIKGDIPIMSNQLKLNLAFVTDKVDDFYVKVDGLVDIYGQIMTMFLGIADPDGKTTLDKDSPMARELSELSGEWIKLSTEELEPSAKEESAKSFECFERTQKAFQNDKAAQKEIVELFKRHQLFKIESAGIETVNGKMANHYRILQADNADQTARQMAEDLIDTKVFKMMDDCVDQDMAKQLKEDIKRQAESPVDTEKKQADVKMDYWVETISHQPLKFSATSSYEETAVEIISNIELNSNPKVEIPKDVKTFEEVQNSLMRGLQEQYGEESLMSPTPDSGSPVLGMSWLN